MKSFAVLAAAGAVLLSGCATTIRSDVTAFNDWPSNLADKSYVFEAPTPPEDTLEHRNYLALVGNEMNKLGFHQATEGQQPQLKVSMHFATVDIPTRILTADDPFWGGPYLGPRWRGGYYPWGYRGYYGPVLAEEQIQHNFQRQLRITIDSVDNRKLYDVTVVNSSHVQSTPFVMPALVQSAFQGFPGQNGVPHRIDLKLDNDTPQEQTPPPAKVASDAKS